MHRIAVSGGSQGTTDCMLCTKCGNAKAWIAASIVVPANSEPNKDRIA